MGVSKGFPGVAAETGSEEDMVEDVCRVVRSFVSFVGVRSVLRFVSFRCWRLNRGKHGAR